MRRCCADAVPARFRVLTWKVSTGANYVAEPMQLIDPTTGQTRGTRSRPAFLGDGASAAGET
jgi:hypothetical protein